MYAGITLITNARGKWERKYSKDQSSSTFFLFKEVEIFSYGNFVQRPGKFLFDSEKKKKIIKPDGIKFFLNWIEESTSIKELYGL